MYGAVSPLSACDGAESWGWLVSSPHPAHWHRSLVTGPGQWWAVGTHPSQPPVRARQTFAQTWKHTKLTYIYILSIIIFMLTPNKLWCVHGSLPCPMEGVECGGKDAQTEKKLSTLSTKKLKTWKYIQRLFLFRETCLIIVIWKNNVVTKLQKKVYC